MSQGYADSVTAIIAAQQSPAVIVSRHDTSFNCRHEEPLIRDAAVYESQGWYCAYPK